MNPNSGNQIWSLWTIEVTPGRILTSIKPEDILPNVQRFCRKAFGSASQMRVLTVPGKVAFQVRSEGHPVHDDAFVEYMRASFDRFFREGFGPGTVTDVQAKLEAGDKQDGTPPEQLVILPSISLVE